MTGMIGVVREEMTMVGMKGRTVVAREESTKMVIGVRDKDMVMVRIIIVEGKVADMSKNMVENMEESSVDMKIQRGHLVCSVFFFPFVNCFFILFYKYLFFSVMF